MIKQSINNPTRLKINTLMSPPASSRLLAFAFSLPEQYGAHVKFTPKPAKIVTPIDR